MSEQTEILEPGGPRSGAGRRSSAVLVTVAILVTAVLGASAYAVYRVFFAGGLQPAEALPASTLGVVTVDLNPAAGQKVEAIKTIRKFPKLKEELGLDADDDLRRFFFEKVIAENECTDVDYDSDIEPWLGKRAAFGAVDLGTETPAPVIALQVTDPGSAADGFPKVEECAELGEDFGYTVTEDYLIASTSKETAEKIVAAAEKAPLSADGNYQKWMDEAGDAGVLSFYVSKDAASFFVDAFGDLGGALPGMPDVPGVPGAADDDLGSREEDPRRLVQEALKDFEGLAGTVRFADGGVELAVAGGGIDEYTGTTAVGEQLGDLPGDTAAALGFSVPGDFVETMLDQVRGQLGEELGAEIDEQIDAFEAGTGLEVPGDVQALLGESVTVSLGGEAPEDLNAVQSPADVPVGLLITGNEERIEEVIEKVEDSLGGTLEQLQVAQESSDGKVVLASSDAYADALLGDGSLADDESFQRAVPEAGKASGVLFVDFDSAWTEAILRAAADAGEDTAEVEDNLKPLETFGLSVWQDDSASHFLLKLTTD